MITRYGALVPRHETREYMDRVATLVRVERHIHEAQFTNGPIVVEATYYKPDKRRRDTDNSRKVLADAVARGLGVDDAQFLWRDMSVEVDRDNPRVELEIYQDA